MTIDSSSARRPAGLRSGLSFWLLGSICLNVAFASYFVVQTLIASPQLTIPYAENEGAAMLDGRIGRFAARLPDKDAEILWEVYRARKPQMAVAMAAAEDARARAISILVRPDLDASALRAAFKEAMESRIGMSDILAETIVDALERISPEGRQQLTRQIQPR
jgi:uncharacterized membrane protein